MGMTHMKQSGAELKPDLCSLSAYGVSAQPSELQQHRQPAKFAPFSDALCGFWLMDSFLQT